jgi:hypothetical protein
VPGFKPSTSGFHFANRHPEIPLLAIDVLGIKVPIGNAANGLCGGMAYAARDYYEAGLLPPPDRTGTDGLAHLPQPLFDFLVKRLFDSFELPGGPAKYMHLMNPDLPDHETDFSRLGLAPHGRAWVTIVEEWPLIRADLDRGVLSPMAFIRVKSHDPFQMGENHQILAYGYDLSWPNLTIHVYDSNYPDRDDVNISLSLADPQHTTDITYSMNDTLYAFFHTNHVFNNPPVTQCFAVAKAGYTLATGIDEIGNPIPNGLADPSVEVVGPVGGGTCSTVIPDDDFPIGPWVASSAGSKWIGLRRRNANGPDGRYRFLARIDLPSDAATDLMGIRGSWGSDDATVDVLVNGVSTGITGGGFAALQAFPPRAGLGLFRPGRNTVEFVVDNAGGNGDNPVGLRVEATLTTVAETDLVTDLAQAAPQRVLPGGTLSVSLTTRNAGALPCPTSWTRLHLTPAGGGAPVYVGNVQIPGLCGGCAASTTHTLVVPADTPPGSYTFGACAEAIGWLTETSDDNNCREGNAITVESAPPPVGCHREDFSSPLIDWVVASGDWRFTAGKLTGTGANGEAWSWSPDLVAAAATGESYSFDLELFDAGGNPFVGRHGGVMFCSTSPTHRMDSSASGYTLDWIDRADDHGLRLLRFDGGAATPLQVGTPQLQEPPRNWRIVLDARSIKVFGDGTLIFDVVDATYRGGSFGVWAYDGQAVRIDNLSFGNDCGSLRQTFDLTQNGQLEISDCISLLGFLYLGKPSRLPCGDGTSSDPGNRLLADYNGDGNVDIADPVSALAYLFLGGPPPRAGLACVRIDGCAELAGGAVCNQ